MFAFKKRIAVLSLPIMLSLLFVVSPVAAETRAELEENAQQALTELYKSTPSAKILGERAKGILIFPSITKGGFIVGGQYGEGALLKGGKVSGFYRSVAASYGLQAGIEKFGYALIFMDEADLVYLDKSAGWEIGVGPTITIVDVGMAKSITSTTARTGVYAFFFEEKGLMAGLGLQGSKITRLEPSEK